MFNNDASQCDAGGKMKEQGYEHWNEPNTGATNEYRFTALQGGHRYYSTGFFQFLGTHGRFWSSTENDASRAHCRVLEYNLSTVFTNLIYKTNGQSVRCLKDSN